MSEKRKPVDLGELRSVAHAVFQAWTSWILFTPTEKAEILALLAVLVNIETQREQARKNEEAQSNIRRLATIMEHQGEIQ
jgi:hypothetical protein